MFYVLCFSLWDTMSEQEYRYIVIHFGELWLKGRNRGTFIKRLYHNIRAALKDEKYEELENARDRFVLRLSKDSDIASIRERLSHVFGISWFAPVMISGNKINEIVAAVARPFGKGDTVRVVAHRSYKQLPFTSQDIVGELLKKKKDFDFTLDKAGEKEVFVNVTRENAHVLTEKTRGLGGLPVGISGKAVILLSGGIDSPVASLYAMKKGLSPIYMHVHAFPNNKDAEDSKMTEIVRKLSAYSPRSKVYFIPSSLFQATIIKAPHQYELVLFKRFLYALAGKIAEKEGADVIVTGESLAQVASQTVKNLIATERGTKQLLMRPLIGLDKQEIVDIAQSQGTYSLSILDYPDVCSLNSRNPSTSANAKKVGALFKEIGLNTVAAKSLKKSETIEI